MMPNIRPDALSNGAVRQLRNSDHFADTSRLYRMRRRRTRRAMRRRGAGDAPLVSVAMDYEVAEPIRSTNRLDREQVPGESLQDGTRSAIILAGHCQAFRAAAGRTSFTNRCRCRRRGVHWRLGGSRPGGTRSLGRRSRCPKPGLGRIDTKRWHDDRWPQAWPRSARQTVWRGTRTENVRDLD